MPILETLPSFDVLEMMKYHPRTSQNDERKYATNRGFLKPHVNMGCQEENPVKALTEICYDRRWISHRPSYPDLQGCRQSDYLGSRSNLDMDDPPLAASLVIFPHHDLQQEQVSYSSENPGPTSSIGSSGDRHLAKNHHRNKRKGGPPKSLSNNQQQHTVQLITTSDLISSDLNLAASDILDDDISKEDKPVKINSRRKGKKKGKQSKKLTNRKECSETDVLSEISSCVTSSLQTHVHSDPSCPGDGIHETNTSHSSASSDLTIQAPKERFDDDDEASSNNCLGHPHNSMASTSEKLNNSLTSSSEEIADESSIYNEVLCLETHQNFSSSVEQTTQSISCNSSVNQKSISNSDTTSIPCSGRDNPPEVFGCWEGNWEGNDKIKSCFQRNNKVFPKHLVSSSSTIDNITWRNLTTNACHRNINHGKSGVGEIQLVKQNGEVDDIADRAHRVQNCTSISHSDIPSNSSSHARKRFGDLNRLHRFGRINSFGRAKHGTYSVWQRVQKKDENCSSKPNNLPDVRQDNKSVKKDLNGGLCKYPNVSEPSTCSESAMSHSPVVDLNEFLCKSHNGELVSDISGRLRTGWDSEGPQVCKNNFSGFLKVFHQHEVTDTISVVNSDLASDVVELEIFNAESHLSEPEGAGILPLGTESRDVVCCHGSDGSISAAQYPCGSSPWTSNLDQRSSNKVLCERGDCSLKSCKDNDFPHGDSRALEGTVIDTENSPTEDRRHDELCGPSMQKSIVGKDDSNTSEADVLIYDTGDGVRTQVDEQYSDNIFASTSSVVCSSNADGLVYEREDSVGIQVDQQYLDNFLPSTGFVVCSSNAGGLIYDKGDSVGTQVDQQCPGSILPSTGPVCSSNQKGQFYENILPSSGSVVCSRNANGLVYDRGESLGTQVDEQCSCNILPSNCSVVCSSCSSSEHGLVNNKGDFTHPAVNCVHSTLTCNKSAQEYQDHRIPVLQTDLDKILKVVNDAYELQTISEDYCICYGIPLADVERFLHSASPVVFQTDKLPSCEFCPHSQLIDASVWEHQLSNVSLENLWHWYETPGNYGLEVKVEDHHPMGIGNARCEFHAYFVPYLSAIQIVGQFSDRTESNQFDFDHVNDNNEEKMLQKSSHMSTLFRKDELSYGTWCGQNELLFEYFESDPPQQRQPLFEKIKMLVRGDISPKCKTFGNPALLESLHLSDIHPASWFSVAWYPIYRIPDGNFRAAFLTYHSFSNLTQRHVESTSGSAIHIVAPAVGLQTYNSKGECWFQQIEIKTTEVKLDESSLSPPEILRERLRTLEQTASVMARASVPKGDWKPVCVQPDYEFFLSRRW